MYVRLWLELPAEASHVRLCRNLVGAMLTEMGVIREDVEDVELIVGEVCANAVRHAYDHPGERYEVELCFAPEQVQVTVRDHGRGADVSRFEQNPQELREGGRGMLLVRSLADRIDFHVQNGTTVTAAVGLHYPTDAGPAQWVTPAQ